MFMIMPWLARLNLAKTYALTYFSIRWNGRTFHKTQFHYVILIHYGNRGNPFFSKYIDSINKMSVFPFPSQESTSIYFNFDYCERCFQIWTYFVIKNQYCVCESIKIKNSQCISFLNIHEYTIPKLTFQK